MLTRNIAKSGEVLNWAGFSPFQLHLGLLVNRSQSASCHIAIRCAQAKKTRQIDQFIAYRKIHPPHTQAHLATQPTSDRFAAKRAFVFQRTL